MNKQGKLINGKVVGGIEWTKRVLPDGTERQGYTWNAVGGCKHECRWIMPDGSTAICYAEAQVNRQQSETFYPQGFAHHYWRPDWLKQPLRVKEPSNIFLDSMSDLMGWWVPREEIEAVLDVCKQASWHTFQLLTKNAPRLTQFTFPKNVQVGVSVPPSSINGKPLTPDQQKRMLRVALHELSYVEVPVRWLSIEPLSFDVSSCLDWAYQMDGAIQWAVIGAATNGGKVYQPDPLWVRNAITSLRQMGAAIFFKGNLRGNAAASEWLEEFPTV